MNSTSKYWCFISYRHADNTKQDRDWASWLHKSIETYEVPAELIGTKNDRGDTIPERIYPVFRDEESLPADADLKNSITNALDNSRFLVCLCSPRAVESKYVAQEIEHFKTTDKGDRIIAAIIAGEPGHKENECFPVPIREVVTKDGKLSEPIAADFRLSDGSEGYTSSEAYRKKLLETHPKKEAKKRAEKYDERLNLMKLKIIAGILGVPLETIRNRDHTYQLFKAKRRRKILTFISTVFATLAALAGFFFNQARKNEEHTQKALAKVEEKNGIILQKNRISQVKLKQSSMEELGQARNNLLDKKPLAGLNYLARSFNLCEGNTSAQTFYNYHLSGLPTRYTPLHILTTSDSLEKWEPYSKFSKNGKWLLIVCGDSENSGNDVAAMLKLVDNISGRTLWRHHFRSVYNRSTQFRLSNKGVVTFVEEFNNDILLVKIDSSGTQEATIYTDQKHDAQFIWHPPTNSLFYTTNKGTLIKKDLINKQETTLAQYANSPSIHLDEYSSTLVITQYQGAKHVSIYDISDKKFIKEKSSTPPNKEYISKKKSYISWISADDRSVSTLDTRTNNITKFYQIKEGENNTKITALTHSPCETWLYICQSIRGTLEQLDLIAVNLHTGLHFTLHTIIDEPSAYNEIQLDPSGSILLFGGSNSTTGLWIHHENSNSKIRASTMFIIQSPFSFARFSSDNRFLHLNSIVYRHISPPPPKFLIPNHKADAFAIYSSEEQLLAVHHGEGLVTVENADQSTAIFKEKLPDIPKSIKFSKSSKFLAITHESKDDPSIYNLLIYDLTQKSLIAKKSLNQWTSGYFFIPGTDYLAYQSASALESTLNIIDCNTTQFIKQIKCKDDSTLIGASTNKSCIVFEQVIPYPTVEIRSLSYIGLTDILFSFNLLTKDELATEGDGGGSPKGFCSRDGRYVAMYDDSGSLVIISTLDKRVITRIEQYPDECVFSPDSKILATTEGENIYIFDSSTGFLIIEHPCRAPSHLHFTSDSKRLNYTSNGKVCHIPVIHKRMSAARLSSIESIDQSSRESIPVSTSQHLSMIQSERDRLIKWTNLYNKVTTKSPLIPIESLPLDHPLTYAYLARFSTPKQAQFLFEMSINRLNLIPSETLPDIQRQVCRGILEKWKQIQPNIQ